MKQVQLLLQDIQKNGVMRTDRTGTGIQSVFGRQLTFDLKLGQYFPAVTLRPFPLKTILHELLWFIQGTDKCDYLDENNVKIWKQWTEPNSNSVGKMYGVQLRKRPSYIEIPNQEQAIQYHLNQGFILIGNEENMPHLKRTKSVLMYKEEDILQNMIDTLKNNPNSKRHVLLLDEQMNSPFISLWNHDYLPDEKILPIDNVLNGRQALANCHGTVIQFNVNPLTKEQLMDYFKYNSDNFSEDLQNKINLIKDLTNNQLNDYLIALEQEYNLNIPRNSLSLQMYQRSADIPTAIGFNIGQYALLLYMVAHITNMLPHQYIHTLGDAHIYNNQLDVVEEILSRDSLDPDFNIQLKIKRQVNHIDDFKIDDFELINYNKYPDYQKVPVAY